jgi:hypothetical protein
MLYFDFIDSFPLKIFGDQQNETIIRLLLFTGDESARLSTQTGVAPCYTEISQSGQDPYYCWKFRSL